MNVFSRKSHLCLSFLGPILGCFIAPQVGVADCIQPLTPQEVLDCAWSQHPWVKYAEAKVVQAGRLENIAQQRPNPEFEANAALGRSENQPVLNVQATLFHTFEMGGKRHSRIEKAEAEKKVISTEVLKAKEQVALTLVPALYRTRQIKMELEKIEEAIDTFTKIKSLLKARPRLTADQEVALTTFRLAESDYRLRKSSLEGEGQALVQVLGLPFGDQFKILPTLLPPMKTSWPDIGPAKDIKEFAGSEATRAQAEVKSAEADLALAQSSAWPNLRIGPTFQNQTQAGLSYQAYGFGFTLPLPLYQTNQGGREYAATGVSQAEIGFQSIVAQLLVERNRAYVEYKAAVRALEAAATLQEIEKSHQQLDQLFTTGRIQASLVIEGHRQMVDLTQNRNDQELKAVTALWRMYVIEGRTLKEKI